jgi:uncharacterized protein (AIM24 family)
MEEHIEFNPSYTLMTYALSPGESVNVEPGAMVAMGGVEMQTRSSGGGLFKSLKKMAFGGESFFLNTFTAGAAGGWVSVAPGSPGDIQGFNLVQVKSSTSKVAPTLLRPSTSSPTPNSKVQRASSAANQCSSFKATSSEGTGRVWYNSFGAIKQIQLSQDKPSLSTPATSSHSMLAFNTPSTRLAA